MKVNVVCRTLHITEFYYLFLFPGFEGVNGLY